MNNLNYASREASQRLVDVGIVLETDFYWYVYNEDMCRSLIAADKAIPAPYLVNRASVRTRIGSIPTAYVPAPSMAEVWRELPEYVEYKKDDRPLIEYLRIDKNGDGSLSCGYGQYSEMTINDNPTDALIDLLIWVRKEAEHDCKEN